MSTAVIEKDNKSDRPRQKRFKVMKACFTCRVKKIKCDGLQPCMQCKARQRPCSFSKDGSADSSEEIDINKHSGTNTPTDSPSPPLVHKESPFIDDKESTLQLLTKLGKIWPGEGKEGKWDLDTTRLMSSEESNWIHRQTRVDLPPRSVVQQLCSLYFKHLYSSFPIIPKRAFLKQLETLDTSSQSLMDPILLLVLCAHGAQFSEQHAHKADDYFCQAKASIEGPLAQPSPSTVIALCLLSLYEPIKDAGLQRLSSMYAAMAFQMCFDLGLMRSYNDKRSAEYSLQKPFDVIEQRKRICWSCYYLDKMIHLQTGQPWMMRSKDIELDMPLLQPGDDIMEHEVLEGFVATIKLLQIAERVIQPESLQQAGQPVIRTHTHDQMSLNLDNELLHWLRCLPIQLQWTPTPTGSSHQHLNINSEPPLNPMVGTMHLIYNFIELHVLRPYTCSTVKSIHQRAAAVATNITQLIMVLSDKRPLWIFHCGFASTALIEATRVQLSDCACENLQLARHSRYMFQQSMHSFRSILTAKPIPSIIRFIQSLDQVITYAETKTTTNEVMSMMEEDIMTPFVLGSLNNKHGYEDEKPQWPKVDPFPNNNNKLVVDKSNKNGLYQQYHSAITDNALFQPSWRMVMSNERQAVGARYDQDQANDNGLELDFLSDQSQQQSWQPYLKKSTPSTSAILNRNMEEEEFYFKKNSQTPSQLLLDDPKIADPSHIAALVAHIQDAKDQGTNDTHETSASASWVNADPPSEKQDVLLLSLWQDDQEKHNRPPPPSYVHYPNVGLGIYASAHQHHNDVIRQHFSVAETARASPSVRSNEP